ncbi:MAG: hypothetical protein IJS31_05815 [Oscillospiraceae bacterium]|nr:hypothetical protein [Oscillospiraceae bacterium]
MAILKIEFCNERIEVHLPSVSAAQRLARPLPREKGTVAEGKALQPFPGRSENIRPTVAL